MIIFIHKQIFTTSVGDNTMERLKTYIKGLDEQLNGGIPKGHVVLLAGKPGTMKSSIGYNILYQNALKEGKKGIYMSLEQGRDSLLEHMGELGMDHAAVDSMVNIVDMGYLKSNVDTSEEGQSWMRIFKMYAENIQASMDYEILVADSLPAIEVMADVKNKRAELFRFFGWLRELGVTVFVISEDAREGTLNRDEDFLSDGIIHLDLKRDDNNVNLFLGVAKMRKSNHARGYFPLIFDQDGFEVIQE